MTTWDIFPAKLCDNRKCVYLKKWSFFSDKKQKKVIFCTIFGVRFYRAAIGFFTKLALSRHRCCLLVVEGRCSARCIDAVRDSSSPDVNAVLKDKIL